MTHYAVLLALALVVNARDPRMLALSAVIGAGIFAPVPAPHFYAWCILGESIIGTCAFFLNATASRIIIRLSVALIGCHIGGYFLNGYPTLSPYRWLVPLGECAELTACILFSRPFLRMVIRER